MTSFGGFGVPGMGALAETTEYEIIFGGERGQGQVLEQNGNYRGEMRDAGNTPTTVIRAGLLMGKTTSGGELQEWSAIATDGTQDIFGIVPYELRAQDFDAADQDRVAGIIVRAPLKAAQLLIEGTNLVGDTDEFLARRQLHAMGCLLDDDTNGNLAGAATRYERVTGTTDTLTASQNGTKLFYSNGASVTVTLPALIPGLIYDLVREGDEEFIVGSAAGDDIIVGNDLSADSVTFTTASEHMGAWVRVGSLYMGTTLKWHMSLPQIPFGTDGTGLTFGILTA